MQFNYSYEGLLPKECDNNDMNLLYKQIALNVDGEARLTAYYTIRQILQGLRGYGDNGPVGLNGPGRLRRGIDAEGDPDYADFLATLTTLATHKIILFKFLNPDYKGPNRGNVKEISVYVTNRYKLERLYAETKWLGERADTRSVEPQVSNLVYYNPLKGRGSVNGNPIHLKKSKRNNKVKAKELFDLLFVSAPNPVPRNEIRNILGLKKGAPDESDRVTQALSNLRRRCGVKKNVISLLQGSGVLNAITVPIDKLPDLFIFPE